MSERICRDKCEGGFNKNGRPGPSDGRRAPDGSTSRTAIGSRVLFAAEELRLALLGASDKYNREWIREKRGYRTPEQVRRSIDPDAAA